MDGCRGQLQLQHTQNFDPGDAVCVPSESKVNIYLFQIR